jgi:hypothetical protein
LFNAFCCFVQLATSFQSSISGLSTKRLTLNDIIYYFFVRHCQNLRILNIFSDLEPLRGSSNKKKVIFNSFLCKLGFFGTRGPLKLSFHSSFKLAHSCQGGPKLHANSLNKLLFCLLICETKRKYVCMCKPSVQ